MTEKYTFAGRLHEHRKEVEEKREERLEKYRLEQLKKAEEEKSKELELKRVIENKRKTLEGFERDIVDENLNQFCDELGLPVPQRDLETNDDNGNIELSYSIRLRKPYIGALETKWENKEWGIVFKSGFNYKKNVQLNERIDIRLLSYREGKIDMRDDFLTFGTPLNSSLSESEKKKFNIRRFNGYHNSQTNFDLTEKSLEECNNMFVNRLLTIHDYVLEHRKNK